MLIIVFHDLLEFLLIQFFMIVLHVFPFDSCKRTHFIECQRRMLCHYLFSLIRNEQWKSTLWSLLLGARYRDCFFLLGLWVDFVSDLVLEVHSFLLFLNQLFLKLGILRTVVLTFSDMGSAEGGELSEGVGDGLGEVLDLCVKVITNCS